MFRGESPELRDVLRHPLLRAQRRLGRRGRARDLIRRYQRLTGRTATDSPAITALISS